MNTQANSGYYIVDYYDADKGSDYGSGRCESLECARHLALKCLGDIAKRAQAELDNADWYGTTHRAVLNEAERLAGATAIMMGAMQAKADCLEISGPHRFTLGNVVVDIYETDERNWLSWDD